eukprot:354248-Chlamydomonas_euryale.AAC.3
MPTARSSTAAPSASWSTGRPRRPAGRVGRAVVTPLCLPHFVHKNVAHNNALHNTRPRHAACVMAEDPVAGDPDAGRAADHQAVRKGAQLLARDNLLAVQPGKCLVGDEDRHQCHRDALLAEEHQRAQAMLGRCTSPHNKHSHMDHMRVFYAHYHMIW